MDVTLVQAGLYALPSQKRVGAIVVDGAQDLALWPGRGPDSDLREAWGPGLQEALGSERDRLPEGELHLGTGIRVHPGRLHCDMLLWLATRPPEPGTEREPAPSAELLERSVTWALEFAAERDVARIAFGALGAGPGELDPEERLERIVRTARAYEERMRSNGRGTVIEQILLCEPDGPIFRAASRRVRAWAKASEAPSKASKRPTKSTSAKKASGRPRGTKKRGLDEDDLARARVNAPEYDRGRTYGEGDWFRHPKFGMGRVSSVTPEGAILVLFEDGQERRMLHGRG